MTTKQKILAYIFIALFVPASLSVLAWWVSSFLLIFGYVKSRLHVVGYSAAFFGAGMIINMFYIKWMVNKSFEHNLKALTIIYLFWSFALIGAFGGVPLGNIVLGAFAGFYMGARAVINKAEIAPSRVYLFVTIVTGGLSMFIGSMQVAGSYAKNGPNMAMPVYIIAFTVIISLMQYFIAKFAYHYAAKQFVPNSTEH